MEYINVKHSVGKRWERTVCCSGLLMTGGDDDGAWESVLAVM